MTTGVLAASSYLSGNTEFLGDVQTYDSYRLFVGVDVEGAVRYLERASETLRAGLAVIVQIVLV